MKIIHLSDTHIIDSKQKNLYGIDPAFRLKQVLKSINKFHKDASMIVITGDLVDRASNEAYENFFSIIKDFSIPIYPIVGNHDKRELFLKYFPKFQTNGFVQYSLEAKEFAFLFLDTLVEDKPFGNLCQKRLDWLEEQLKKYSDKKIYLFMHHHPLKSFLYEMDNVANLKNSDKFWSILDKHDNILHITYGHLHRITQMQRKNISLHSTKSTTFQVAFTPNETKEYLTNEEKPTYCVMILNDTNLILHHHEFLHEDEKYIGYC